MSENKEEIRRKKIYKRGVKRSSIPLIKGASKAEIALS